MRGTGGLVCAAEGSFQETGCVLEHDATSFCRWEERHGMLGAMSCVVDCSNRDFWSKLVDGKGVQIRASELKYLNLLQYSYLKFCIIIIFLVLGWCLFEEA